MDSIELNSVPKRLIGQGKLTQAESHIKNDLKNAPKNIQLLSILSEVYRRQKRFNEALEINNKIVDIAEELPLHKKTEVIYMTSIDLCNIYMAMSDTQKAKEAAIKCTNILPDNALGHSLTGKEYARAFDINSSVPYKGDHFYYEFTKEIVFARAKSEIEAIRNKPKTNTVLNTATPTFNGDNKDKASERGVE